jgi:hypothetical protein
VNEGFCQSFDFGSDVFQRLLFSFRKRIRGIAIGTAQIARGKPHENARQTRKGAFTLQAQINFIDDERL